MNVYIFFLILAMYPAVAFSRAGGLGGFGGIPGVSHGHGGLIFMLTIVTISLILYLYRKNKIFSAKINQIKACENDSAWDLKVLKKVTKKTFFAYQEAWMNKDIDLIRSLLHEDYFVKVQKK